ncbi:MAG: Hsp20/alpha crystallin family protein [Gammaproteobacteria bacterium]|nr:MAG: Hsp20/alpha crystallin family protein [Gammaproteobacteria bacterium]
MATVRWSPWQELEDIQRTLMGLRDGDVQSARHQQGSWMPAVDVRETSDALVIHVELPGVEKENIRIEMHEGRLSISGERPYVKEDEEEHVHRIERAYGRFARSFSLPRDIDTDRVQASMDNGVLKIRLPKRGAASSRTIEIS